MEIAIDFGRYRTDCAFIEGEKITERHTFKDEKFSSIITKIVDVIKANEISKVYSDITGLGEPATDALISELVKRKVGVEINLLVRGVKDEKVVLINRSREGESVEISEVERWYQRNRN